MAIMLRLMNVINIKMRKKHIYPLRLFYFNDMRDIEKTDSRI